MHWNFYFTLAGVYLVYSFLRAFGKWASGPAVAILIACGMHHEQENGLVSKFLSSMHDMFFLGYQVYMSQLGGEEYILDAPRDNLMSQNREGILSLAGALISIGLSVTGTMQRLILFSLNILRPGYSSLYLLSVYAGGCIFGYMDSNGAKLHRNMRWLVISLFVVAAFLWATTFLSVRLVARPSRRMVRILLSFVGVSTTNGSQVRVSCPQLNLSYLLWVMAESITLLALYCAIQTVWYVIPRSLTTLNLSSDILANYSMLPRVPLLFQGINHNQLFVFIVVSQFGIMHLLHHTMALMSLCSFTAGQPDDGRRESEHVHHQHQHRRGLRSAAALHAGSLHPGLCAAVRAHPHQALSSGVR